MNPEEEIPPEVAHRAYFRQPVWKRIVVIAAGPAVNIVLAFLILWVLIWANGVAEPTTRVASVDARARRPPACCGPGDQLVAVDGVRGDPATTARADRARTSARASRSDGLPGGDARPSSGSRATASERTRRGSRPSTTPTRERMLLGFGFGGGPRAVGPGARPPASASTACGSSPSSTVETIAGIFEAEKRKQISGVVGSYEATRQTIELELERGALPARDHLAVARRHQPVPVPAARRRAHLLGAGREGARPRDPVQRHGARRLRRLRARDRAVLHRLHERHRPADRRGLRAVALERGPSWRRGGQDAVHDCGAAASRRRAAAADHRRGLPDHRRGPPRPGRGPHEGRRGLADLERAARPRRRARRRAARARRAARRHRRADARQPARVPRRRPRGDDARRDAVLDLRDLLARADRLRRRRRGREGRDRRGAVRRRVPGGARAAAGARARDRARGRARRGDHRLARRRGDPIGLRRRAALARGRARGRHHADLHVGHHRAAEGRPARRTAT